MRAGRVPIHPSKRITMKTRHLLLCTLFAATALSAETVTLTLAPILPLPSGATVKAQSQTITLAAGDTAELIFAPIPEPKDYDEVNRRLVQFDTAGQSFQWQTIVSPAGWDTAEDYALAGLPKIQPVKVAGPGTLKLISAWADTKTAVTFTISRASAIPTVTPANAVVIPNDATGTFQVILESSTDLITWTASTPGSYSGTTQQRFFRTRIVRQ